MKPSRKRRLFRSAIAFGHCVAWLHAARERRPALGRDAARSYVTEAGETSWTPIVEITGGENRARFQALAVAAAFQLLRDAA